MKYLLPKHYVMLFIAGIMLSTSAQALMYTEIDNGRFSNDPSSMTTITFDVGANTVTGAADNGLQGDADFFSFTLQPGETLTAINLLSVDIFSAFGGFGEPTSFFGIGDLSRGTPSYSNSTNGLDPGDNNTSLFTASLFGASNVGPLGGAQYNLLDAVNRTLIDEENASLTFIPGFNDVLGPGSYWVWLSETEGSLAYQLEFIIDSANVQPMPLPATFLLLAGPLGLLMKFRKKQYK